MKIQKILLFFVFFTPLFPVQLNESGIHVVFVSIAFSLLWIFINFEKIKFDYPMKFALFSAIFAFILLQVSMIRDIFSVGSNFSDVIGILRPLYFFLFFSAFYIGFRDVSGVNTYIKTLMFIFVMLSIHAILEVYGPDSFKKVNYLLYKREYKEIIQNKSVSTLGITYMFAYIMLLPSFYFLFSFIRDRKFTYLLLFLTCSSSIFLSQSRTIFIAYLLSLLITPLLIDKRDKKSKQTLFAFFLLMMLFVAYIFVWHFDAVRDSFLYIFKGITKLFTDGIDFSGQGEGSINIRVMQFYNVLSEIDTFPFFGLGLGRELDSQLESVYAFYLYRYGLFFLIVFIFSLIYFSKISREIALSDKLPRNFYPFFMSVSLFFLLSPISLIASATNEAPRVSVLFFSLIASIFFVKKRLDI